MCLSLRRMRSASASALETTEDRREKCANKSGCLCTSEIAETEEHGICFAEAHKGKRRRWQRSRRPCCSESSRDAIEMNELSHYARARVCLRERRTDLLRKQRAANRGERAFFIYTVSESCSIVCCIALTPNSNRILF